MEVELDFKSVRDRWLAAGGKDSGGIIGWFAPPIVKRWIQSEIPAREVAELRFIGAELLAAGAILRQSAPYWLEPQGGGAS